ncbi:hypothetical protein CSC70_08385 [Pseudoxanthomonas kalamensis DSM 18571]|uniref:hypothetical protein n=1 Tax=Pseudoxanthomonas kalamensis TaxID=289483 RepID=UPI001391B2E6|nr:hypothetical protein [Pseudoxanthomonas kalamensis]KAF1710657.1 hypothetical protein CSC70_08385 [Pseudoxanthomonas kalamensis DSM 18571]
MSKKSLATPKKQPSLFAVWFGSFTGLVIAGYGAIMLFMRPTGLGLCRRFCGLHQAFLDLLGQPVYNLLSGLFGVVVGLSFIVFLIYQRARG